MNLIVVSICLLVTHCQYSQVTATDQSNSDHLNKSISLQPVCKEDVSSIRKLCDISEKDVEDNLVLLECLERVPAVVKLSVDCETLVWRFKTEVTRSDHFLAEAKTLCSDEHLCEHELESGPGHLLACLVAKRHEARSPKCGQFLTLVNKTN